MKKETIRASILIVLIMAVTFILSYFEPFYSVDKMVTDAFYQRPSAANPAIKIIKIDEKSMAEFGPYQTWTRDIPARLVEKLSENPDAKPSVIAFDILYISEMDEAGDARFADACAEAGNVIVGSNVVFRKTVKMDTNGDYYVDELNIDMTEEPYETLKQVTTTAFANTTQDKDGYIRQALAYIDTENGRQKSLAYQIYEKYMDKQGQAASMPELYANQRFDFQFSGKSGTYEAVSLCDVLSGKIDPRVFTGSIVLIGAYAPGMQDAYNVAIQRGMQMYGVEIHANIVEALLEGKTAVPANKTMVSVMMALTAGVFFLLIRKMKMIFGVFLLLAVTAAEIGTGVLMWSKGHSMPLLYLPVVLVIVYVAHVATEYLVELNRKREVVKAFKKYVAPQVVDEVSKSGEFKLVLGGERRDIAVLFVDIRGFTPMSEGLEPEQVVEVLNEYLHLTTTSIFKNGGTLDKFIGDATMAVFNAPFDLDDYVFKAVCTARDIAAGSDKLEKTMMERFGKTVSFGIGVNCGPAVVGNIGCDFRMDYTAIGDTVNTAARLESNAKRRQILISEDVYEKVKDRVEATSIGEIPLKGKSKAICVYSVDKVLGEAIGKEDKIR